ncbi:MAG: hypothetical protein OXU23_03055 [Candidatus Poribacteria bacterium]|nr:hypothetical protein [Candidatus Poribacteria bacterium]
MEGYALGLSLGLAIGVAAGTTSTSSSTRKKVERQLRNAIVDKEISIRDKDGEPLKTDVLFALLDKKYKKV